MSLLKVEHLNYHYENAERTVLKDISFEVDEGEIFCLAGPNGCGKTTLQRLILKFLKKNQGTIVVDGKDATSYKDKEYAELIAYVPQNHECTFPYFVEDVILMGITAGRGILYQPKARDYEEVYQMMGELGISHLIQKMYSNLSGGELQIVLIARALCQKSKIIVMDEPTSHLDFSREKKVLKMIAKMVKEHGRTVVFTTHDMNHALYFEDEALKVKLALMGDGVLYGVDVPSVILQSPLMKEIYELHTEVLAVEREKTHHFMVSW